MSYLKIININVNFAPEQNIKAQREEDRGIAVILYLSFSA